MQINWEYKCFAISLEKYAEHGCQKDKLFFSNFLKISGSGVWEIPAGATFLIFAVKMRNLHVMAPGPEKGKLKVPLRCERGQVVHAKIYKGQIYIKYDAPNTYI